MPLHSVEEVNDPREPSYGLYGAVVLDMNFAKMDRIVHSGIEDCKRRVFTTKIHGLTIAQWSRSLSSGTDEEIRYALAERFNLRRVDIGEILE